MKISARPTPNRVAFLALALAACSWAGSPEDDAVAPGGQRWDAVVARVNDTKVTRGDLARFLMRTFGRQWLTTMMNQELVLIEAQARGVACTPDELEKRIDAEVESRVEREARRRRMTIAQYADWLKSRDQDIDDLRASVRAPLNVLLGPQVLAEKLLRAQVVVEEKDIREEYNLRYGPRVRVRHVEVDSREKARQVLAELAAGADFQALAGQKSLDQPSRRNGFEITPPPSAESRIGKRALALRPGERAVVQEGDRYHVIEFVENVPGKAEPYEKAADRIREQIVRREILSKRQAWLEGLMKTYQASLLYDSALPGWKAVLAQVGPRKIRREDLAELIVKVLGKNNLNALILHQLVAQEAARLKVSVSEEEFAEYMKGAVERRLEAESKELGFESVGEYDQYLKKRGLSLAQRRQELRVEGEPFLRAEQLVHKCLERTLKVSQLEIEHEYRQRYDAKVAAQQIVLARESDVEEVKRLLERGHDFGRLASELSVDPAGRRQRGKFEIRKEGELGRALFEMKAGERRKISVGKDWHYVEKLEDIPAKSVRLEEVREEIRRDLLEAKIARERDLWLLDLQAAATVEVFQQ